MVLHLDVVVFILMECFWFLLSVLATIHTKEEAMLKLHHTVAIRVV